MKCKCCGKDNPDDTKFCGYCGTAFYIDSKIEASGVENQSDSDETIRKNVFEGNIHKCPNCGEIVGAFSTRCAVCGFEFRDINSNERVKDFFDKLEKMKEFDDNGRIKNYSQVADHIKNYVIPNTKEDVLEFMILASSNIDVTDKTGTSKIIYDAWCTKLEQVYQKASFSFGNDSDFQEIHRIYVEKREIIQKNEKKQKEKKRKPLIIVGTVLFFLYGLPIIIFLVYLGVTEVIEGVKYLSLTPEEKYERELNDEVDTINGKIYYGHYNEAMIMTMGLRYDKYDNPEKVKEWDEKREYLIEYIKEKQENEKVNEVTEDGLDDDESEEDGEW